MHQGFPQEGRYLDKELDTPRNFISEYFDVLVEEDYFYRIFSLQYFGYFCFLQVKFGFKEQNVRNFSVDVVIISAREIWLLLLLFSLMFMICLGFNWLFL